MAVREHQKRGIALAQLETAPRLYLDNGDMFSALTLAGAAEVILGGELKALGVPTALKVDQDATTAISQTLRGVGIKPELVADVANYARNAVKHFDAGDPLSVWMDPVEEARTMLVRATDNYFRLTGDQTELMAQFLRAIYG